MSLTVHQIGLAALRRIGVLSFDPSKNANNQNRRGLLPGDLDEVLIALNGGLEECFGLGPTELGETRGAVVLNAPTAITVNVTGLSATVANFTTYAAWMQGCTIRIPGDSRDNEIVSDTQLLRPYMGATATATPCTVFADAVPLDSSIVTIMEPVEIPFLTPLQQASSRDEFNQWCYFGGYPGASFYYTYISGQKPQGQPIAWFCDTRYNATNAFTQRFLRVSPMPGQPYSLSYRAKVKPPTYTQADFYSGTSYDTDPMTVIPFDWVESTLLPVVLQRFVANPAFDNPTVAAELSRQAEVAKKTFQESSRPMSAPRFGYYANSVRSPRRCRGDAFWNG